MDNSSVSVNDLTKLTILHFPKELLDKVFCLLDTQSSLSFLLTCKLFNQTCQSTLLRIKPLNIYYGGKSFMPDNKNLLQITYSALRHLETHRQTYKEVKVIKLSRISGSSYYTRKKQAGQSYGSLTTPTSTPFPRVDNLMIEKFIISSLPKFERLRFLVMDVKEIDMLLLVLQNLPKNLKGISLLVKSIKSNTSESLRTIDINITSLQYFGLISIAKHSFVSSPIKTRDVINTQLTGFDLEDRIFRDFREKVDNSNLSTNNLSVLGRIGAEILINSSSKLQTINITGVDSYEVFCNKAALRKYPNLKVIKLCNVSIPKLNWWLPELESLNTELKPATKRAPLERLPTMALVFSNLFVGPPAAREREGQEQVSRIECRARFFGDHQNLWFGIRGSAMEFWQKFYYE
ncbi:hypothetical protein CANARDRAFT_26198 [[Candida] arabinofermentans NRRL YB-2248]|uniref:F-box domain-containing protein n=1 Tax=[Candida] arabinofermentans NRRL YB-2248 TaxID=983967 RepID=A0A1E4T8Q4_9ASCO|nr:hypothetical protein CANARDRAFT_26198 [[Candida] arabinofermentans NRRL YB-2248]